MSTQQRFGDWMQVASGGRVYPFDPRPEEIHIQDIAAALSKICRFGGHCREFYSVAQHSVLVSRVCESEDALWGLLHDASEAYLGDIPRPIKRHSSMWIYSEAEQQVMAAVASRFGLGGAPEGDWNMPRSVHRADEVLLATEARDLMGNSALERWDSLTGIEPLEDPIVPWAPKMAAFLFMARFKELTGAINER